MLEKLKKILVVLLPPVLTSILGWLDKITMKDKEKEDDKDVK